jgi:prevent-host-death family protein
MVMNMVNIAEAKSRLSELIDAATRGEQVIICHRNAPVAELRPLEPVVKAPRDLTPAHPDWTIDAAFFDPLDQNEVDAWYGGVEPGEGRVAESRPPYASRRRGKRPRR